MPYLVIPTTPPPFSPSFSKKSAAKDNIHIKHTNIIPYVSYRKLYFLNIFEWNNTIKLLAIPHERKVPIDQKLKWKLYNKS